MSFRNNLQQYIDNPGHELVVYSDEHVVIIEDKYPKSVCHYLVLPKDDAVTYIHPCIALKDKFLREKIAPAIQFAKKLAAEEFVKRNLIPDTPNLRASFCNTYVKVGVHSVPSMANLHIHVLTRDMHLPCMKNRKHYNSFNTDFFVELSKFDEEIETSSGESSDSSSSSSSETANSPDKKNSPPRKIQSQLPISADGRISGSIDGNSRIFRVHGDAAPQTPAKLNPKVVTMRTVSHHSKTTTEEQISNQLKKPLQCWHCTKTFGNRFVQLKEHLRGEFHGRFHAVD